MATFDDKLKRALASERVTVSEAALSRLLSKAAEPFAIITAYRGTYQKADNIVRNRQLRTILNANRLGVHQLVGHWRECQDQAMPYEECPAEKLKDVVERSYFVQKPLGMALPTFKWLLNGLATGFDQDGFIMHDGYTVWLIGRGGSEQAIGRAPTLGAMGQAYSQHVRKLSVPFVFEGLEVPVSTVGRMLWRQTGLIVPPADSPCRDLMAESVN